MPGPTIKDVHEMVGNARSYFSESAAFGMLPGMKRPLTTEDWIALSYYHAALNYLNRQGALNQDWLKQNPVLIEHADSTPAVDDDADSAANPEE